ncbi:cytochrome P450 71A1-like [Camellia sinensis]|uniref:cytochrome P450 71A1-like n=1 Tax=Camellia sinensis TaxID=4442 RepID=UPI00103558B9|nr:cytochrome P450 71A1-like [Camellia sinensis]XP_028096544.1 cytochrome P450 71A1-like [Camellia sinensis]
MLLLYLGGAPTLVVNSAKIAKEIMKTHDIAFANRVQTRAADALMYGCTSLGFAPYGEYWRQMRRICVLELLSIKRVQSFHFVREEEVAMMIEKIRNNTSLDGGANFVNLGDMLVDTMTSIISRCILGKKYGEDNKKRFGQLARNGMELLIEFSFQDFFPSFGWIDALTGLVKRLKDTSQGLDAFLDDVIEIYQTSKGNDDQPGNKCLIEILLHLQEEGKLEIDISQDNLKGILLVSLSLSLSVSLYVCVYTSRELGDTVVKFFKSSISSKESFIVAELAVAKVNLPKSVLRLIFLSRL